MDFSTRGPVTRRCDTTPGPSEPRRRNPVGRAAQAVLYIAGVLCAAMALTLFWTEIQGRRLDTAMDLVNAARGGS